MTEHQLRHVIAADVGGTKIAFMLAQVDGTSISVKVRRVYPSRDYGDFDGAIGAFLSDPQVAARARDIAAACFAVAGPVDGDAAMLPNLGWQIDAAALVRSCGIPQVSVINDFSAVGLGIAHLQPDAFAPLQDGSAVPGATRLIVGAGTGLGVSLLTDHDGSLVVHPSEGGHSDFAPINELQDRLLAYLRKNFGRVSVERVVSGPGLLRIFSFMQESGMGLPSKALLEAAKRTDPAEAIAEFAMNRLDPLAVRTLDLFVACYGSFTGNMALATLARGGVYIAGGIAPKIAAKLTDGEFMRAFCAKGRFSGLLQSMPVNVVMNADVGLMGALASAVRHQ